MVAEILIVPDDSAQDSARAGAQYIARGLSAVGIRVREQISLCTDRQKLQQAISVALGRSNILLTIGGLGKASGYLAKAVMSQGLGLPLSINAECLAAIREYCQRTGEPFSDEDRELATLPQGSVWFAPTRGKVPGMAISASTQHIVMLPSSQQELTAMWGRSVAPFLSGTEASASATHTLRTWGLREEIVREKLLDLTAAPSPTVTIHKEDKDVIIRVSAHAASTSAASAICAPVLREIARRFGDSAYGLDMDSMQSAVVAKIRKKNLGLAIAESGTGGMLTRVIDETEGGQDILRYSTNADTRETKVEKLGASEKLLKKHGFVSEYAAVALASGARMRADTDIGIAIVAHADSSADKKSRPGQVYIAVCDAFNVYVKKLVVGEGDAATDVITDAALSRAINMLRLFVDYLPGSYKGCIDLEEALAGRLTVTDRDSYHEDEEADGEVPEEKPGFFRRLASNFRIRKTDAPGVKVKKAVFIIAVLVFLGCAGYLGWYYLDSYMALQQARTLQGLYEYGDLEDVDVSPDFPKRYLENFGALWTINSDIVGFISVDDTMVKYPVVQAEDNDFYLRRDYYGNNNNHGIPFMDYRVDIEKPSDNFVIYGHNMKDGQIFGELLGYKNIDYYREHPIINFDTLVDPGRYKIFSVFITNAHESQGPVFPYHDFINAASADDFNNYISQLRVRSLITMPVDVEPGDQLITLSTCSYEFSDARFVIVARKVRRGESEEVDTQLAAVNPQPLYPDIWYQVFGGTKPSGIPDNATVVTTPTTNVAPREPLAPTDLVLSSSSTALSESLQTSRQLVYDMVASNREASRLASEQAESEAKAASLASEKAASEAEVVRLASEKAASEAESSRLASEAEASRIASEQAAEAARKKAEEDIAMLAADAEAAAKDTDKTAKAVIRATDPVRAESDLALLYDAMALADACAQSAVKAAETAGTDTAKKAAAKAEAAALTAAQNYEKAEEALLNLQAQAEAESESTSNTGAGNADNTEETPASSDAGTLTVYAGGKKVTDSAAAIVARIVQNEMGSAFHEEAIKAQAVAAYSYITHQSKNGTVPTAILSSSADKRVQNLVSQVIGEAVYYNGRIAFTPYHATSAGATTSSKAVWGGSYPYLVSVDSSIETGLSSYRTKTTISRDKVEALISSKLGIEADGDPGGWFEVLSEADGGYNGNMSVCGETRTRSGSTITGRLLREQVLGLRSACFTVDYDDGRDAFVFTVYGYGHGVGMSQNGANLYAKDGWSYIDILEHYYPGTSVQ